MVQRKTAAPVWECASFAVSRQNFSAMFPTQSWIAELGSSEGACKAVRLGWEHWAGRDVLDRPGLTYPAECVNQRLR